MTNPDDELRKFLEQLLTNVPEEADLSNNKESNWIDVSQTEINLESEY